jgi:lipopolysaccharide/colanic/teichoic acid biosynthesis glycosyltransferase
VTPNINLKPVRQLDPLYGSRPIHRARRCADMVVACVMLLTVAPLFLLMAVAVKLEDAGPIFVRRACLGCHGSFEKLSFRTTVFYDPVNLPPIWGQRLTRLGKFLNITRMDGLPQIINVLRGEMSFFDPAADLPSFLN